jgi:adenylate kinase
MEKLDAIKQWLGSGSINLFGLPFSGKDTIGNRLATDLGGAYVSSGDILRSAEAVGTQVDDMSNGKWVPQQQFFDLVLPYFSRPELVGLPIVLGAVGRWSGEEHRTMSELAESGHEIKLAIIIDITEAEVRARFDADERTAERGTRVDDQDLAKVQSRINEFYSKTTPVLETYRNMGRLITVNSIGTRDEVYQRIVEAISEKISAA